MLTYNMEDRKGMPLYEYLYNCIKEDILNGTLLAGDKLPSKREFARHNGISIITVENAYEQLLVEGYIYSLPRKGFFVSEIYADGVKTDSKNNDNNNAKNSKASGYYIEKNKENNKWYSKDNSVGNSKDNSKERDKGKYITDFTSNKMSYDSFPFNNWAKLMRRSLLDEESNFFEAPDPLGDISLRRSISKYLSQYRGLDVNPDNIIVGAGMEYLYGLLISIIGRDKLIAVEDPGYKKAQMVFEANGSTCIRIPVDEEGMEVDRLGDKDISLVHVTPSHHFPLGFVMSAGRKHKLISWANAMDAYILEDDYDSDFRFKGRPISALASIDSKRVVYMNTFTKTLARSIRMAYMVLPDSLMKKYRENLEFYSSTVTVFEQRTLAYFIENGFYERHINRMRSRYKKSRDDMINCLSKSKLSSICRVFDEGIGLHFIIKVDTNRSDEDIKNDLLKDGIKIKSVLDYCEKFSNKYNHMFIINYLETKEINIINAYDKIYEKCSLK